MPVLRVGMDAVVVAATLVGLCEATAFTRYRLARPAWLGDWLMALLPPLMLTAMARVGGFPLPWGLWPTVTVAQSYWLDWPLYAAATVAAMAAWAVSGGPALPGALALGVVAAVAAWSPIRRRAARVGLLLASGWGIAAAAGWPGAGTRLAPGPALGEELLAGALLAGYVLSHRERTQALSAAVEAVARDHLTGALTPEGLETWLESWARPPRGLVAIVDLNDFKAVNDTYGHPVGDQLLSALARRLRQGLRNGDVVARVGGDEIACWCPGAEEEGAAQLAERLYHAVIADPVSTSAGPIRLDACLGWAVGPLGPETAARAERALLRAKRPGAPPVAGPEALQEPESLPVPGGPRWLMDAVQRLWSAWEEPAVLVDPDGRILTANGAFRRWAGKPWPQLVGQGLPELPPGAGSVPVEVGGRLAAYWLHLPGVRLPGETAQGLPGWVVTPGFTRDRRWAVAPVFQPIVALPGGEVLGYEALSRPSWEGRPVDPETLFHAAAAAGTTLEADLACFAAVARAVLAAPWPAGALLFVNVSPRSLMTPDRLHPVLDPLVAALPPGRVVLEISEHVPEDIPYSLWEELPRVYPGVQWAQDDYGLGNADPSRMLAVRPQWLKLDRTLMLQALADAAGRTWLRRFAAWAQGEFGMRLVVEGVETAEQADALAALGLTAAQGYLFGRPMATPALATPPAAGDPA